MSAYPPFPLFTFVGFLVHAVVFFAIGVRFLKRWQSTTFMYIGCAAIIDSLNFVLVLLFFFAFPNDSFKANVFLFNSVVIKPLVSIFAIMGLISLSERFSKLAWVFFAVALCALLLLYWQTFHQFQTQPVEFAYVHPVYPEIVTQSEASGVIGALAFAVFFLYQGFVGTLFIRKRALVLAAATFLLSFSAFYWVSTGPALYIATHTIGPIGSLLLAAGIFMFSSKSADSPEGEMVL